MHSIACLRAGCGRPAAASPFYSRASATHLDAGVDLTASAVKAHGDGDPANDNADESKDDRDNMPATDGTADDCIGVSIGFSAPGDGALSCSTADRGHSMHSHRGQSLFSDNLGRFRTVC